ncbi:condensation domain-containing protein, partial [Acidobacteriota bacterium]
MPLTPNGKIDKKALPAPGLRTGKTYVAPRHETEEKLLEIWVDVLGVREAIGIDDNFFELGGHSLNVTIMVAKIHKEFQVNIKLNEIFELTTIRGIAGMVIEAAGNKYAAIEPTEKKDYYPLSSAQMRLYFIQQMDKNDTAYNIPTFFRIEGEINRRLEDIFKKLIERHESLRTSFHLLKGQPMQEIHNEVKFEIEYYIAQRKAQSAERQEGHHAQCAVRCESTIENFIRLFDLTQPPLLRVGLIKLETKKHILMTDMHHIISDGLSMSVLIKEFMALYEGKDEPLPELPIQYKDFSRWQNSLMESGRIKEQEEYWLDQFKGEIPVLDLPTDYLRPAVQRFEGTRLCFEPGKQVTGQLTKLSSESNTTMFMVLLTVFSIFLSKLSGQEDIIVGSPIAGRRHEDLENIIGMFVNMLVLRTNPSGKKSFKSLLSEVKECTSNAYENQDYQYENLVDKVVKNRDMSRNPLFDVVFMLQNIDFQTRELPGINLTPYEYEGTISKFDMTLNSAEIKGQLFFTLEYCTRLFKKETIERFVTYFKKVLNSVLENPEQPISGIEIISNEEKCQILCEFNDTHADYPRDKTIHELFENQVERTPDYIAAVGQSTLRKAQKAEPEEERHAPCTMHHAIHTITYRELSEKSLQLALRLRQRGVHPDTLVGIMKERSIEIVIGILAILKAGGAYLPIDPDYPGSRVKYILNDTSTKMLLTKGDFVNCYSDITEPIDLENPRIYTGDNNNMDSLNTPGDLAYVMYTSGSTGGPKGVMVDHRNVVRLVKNANYVGMSGETRILQTGAPVFDASTFEIWAPLLNGGRLVLEANEVILDAHKLGEALKKHQINVLWLSAPLFNQLVQQTSDMFSTLEWLLVGGDVLSSKHINLVRNRNKELNVVNGYGPTENTTFSTTYLIDKDYQGDIPIG